MADRLFEMDAWAQEAQKWQRLCAEAQAQRDAAEGLLLELHGRARGYGERFVDFRIDRNWEVRHVLLLTSRGLLPSGGEK